LIFPIELISNFIRPFSLGIRLFGNMFADEKVMDSIAHLAPGITYWLEPVLLMPLSLFVAFIQTFVFVLIVRDGTQVVPYMVSEKMGCIQMRYNLLHFKLFDFGTVPFGGKF
jgi:hypothetical protein